MYLGPKRRGPKVGKQAIRTPSGTTSDAMLIEHFFNKMRGVSGIERNSCYDLPRPSLCADEANGGEGGGENEEVRMEREE